MRGMRFKWTLTEVLIEVCLTWTLLFAAGFGQGSVPTTTIADTVYSADGTGASGTVLISWPAFTSYSGVSVPAGSTSVTIGSGGTLDVALVPNAGSTPMGSYYTVVYHLADSSSTREYWVVPVSVGSVKLSVIRNTVLPASVAMQTVSKTYVDTAITAAVTGHPLDASTPYVLKTGDAMTGPLVLPGDPTAALQAADKQYVDEQITGAAAGLGQKVSLQPVATQVVTQPVGTQLQVNQLNGAQYASQYVSGDGNNGIAQAAAGPDCTTGCNIVAEQTYVPSLSGAAPEAPAATTWNDKTQLEDYRFGTIHETHINPLSLVNPGQNSGRSIEVTSTQTADAVLAATGEGNQFSTGLTITNNGLAGGSNVYPKLVQTTVPYFKTTYSTLNMTGNNNTLGQHVLVPETQNCYGVGDCLMGGMFLSASGGYRDDADEGAHPFDLQIAEDSRVFDGTCTGGCTTGSTALRITPTANNGTQGDGRYLIDMNPSKVLTTGRIVGSNNSGRQAAVDFSGTGFPVSVFLETAVTIPTQSNSIMPGTVTVPIVTSGVPAGFQTNTAALPAATGVACVSDVQFGDARPLNFETAAYTVVDGSHLQMTLVRPHSNGATLAVGGMCGYGLEQTADTVDGIRQVFPVIGSATATELLYAASEAAVLGVSNAESAFANLSYALTSLVRNNNMVTATTSGNFGADASGLALTLSGVADPSYNGTFVITTTGINTFTYSQTGANSTSSGGTATYQKGAFVLYPMAEVQKVYSATTKAVDGQMTLAANTVPWAAGDTVEQPHYFQEIVYPDTEFITQYEPRPRRSVAGGITYQGNTGPGVHGWLIDNATPASNYYGNGGTHTDPYTGIGVQGPWTNSFEAQAGDSSVMKVHCNSHGCDKWNSAYDLFQLDTTVGLDRMNYQPATSTLNFNLRGTGYQFNPNGFTAGTINATTVNAAALSGTLSGSVTPASLPVFGASGSGHVRGAVPDPGATAGTTRFLREDGTWAAAGGSTAVVASNGYTTTAPSLLPQRSNLLAEYLLTEGSGTVAHDTSGQGNDGTIIGPTWEGSAGLNFTATGQYIQLPAGVNAAKAWQFAIYAPPFGTLSAPQPPGYGAPNVFGTNPALLCGTDSTHLCLIAVNGWKSLQLQAYTTDGTEAAQTLTAGWHIVSFLCGSNVGGVVTKTKILYDGMEVGGYVVQGDAGTCPTPTSGNYQIGGSTLLTGTWFLGKVAAAWAWNTPLTKTEGTAAAKSALDYIKSKGVQTEFSTAPHTAPLILAGIDSRTYGTGLPAGADWVTRMALNDSTFTRVNLAVPGELTADACPMFDATFGSQLGSGQGPVITMLWGGVNDFLFSAQTSRQIANNLECMVQKARATGSKVVLATEISSTSPAGPAGDNGKNGLNAILRAEAFSWGVDSLADLATDVHLGADGASANTSCFPDNLHPSTTCESYITAIMQNAINELVGSTVRNRNATAAATYQETAADDFLDLTGTAAQAVTLPDCTGYSRTRQMVNLGAANGTVGVVTGQTLVGSATLTVGTQALFVPIPGALATGGCHWERTQ